MTDNTPRSAQSLRPIWQKDENGEPWQMGNFQAVIYVAITVLILAYSTLVGAGAILLLYTLWLPYSLSRSGLRLKRAIRGNILPTFYIALCITSVAWSEYWAVTARSALETASMLICALTISQLVNFNDFIKALSLGIAITLTASLASNNYGIDYFSGTYSLVGLFGSKNQVGLFAEIGVIVSLVYFFSSNRIWNKAIFGLLPLGISLVCLHKSQSATSLASLVIVLLACSGFYILAKIPRALRTLTTTIFIFIIFCLIAAGITYGLYEAGFSLLGKDTTLTGRTFLWAEGIKAGMSHPLGGYGFNAFWVPGQPKAEEYWYKFDIYARSGFHFHNTFVESFAELGIPGFMVAIALYFRNLRVSLKYVMSYRLDAVGFYALSISLMLFIRAFVEVDVWGTFNIGSLLFFTVISYLKRCAPPLKINQG